MSVDKIRNHVTTKNILVVLLGTGIFYFMFTSIMTSKFSQLETDTRSLLADQHAMLVAIAEATARSGVDTVTESFIRDCSLTERNEFDSLLNRLDKGLSRIELTSLERLFGRCGTFYSTRKAVMAAKLTREVEVYETFVQQLSTILNEDMSKTFSVSTWKALAIEEKKQSDSFMQLVGLQDKIISTLLSGKSQTSTEMQEILNTVQTTQEALTIANQRASAIRTDLASI